MSRLTIVEGNTNDKDNVRAIMVKGEKGEKGDNGEITYSDVIDNLTSTETQKPLSANQGKQLKDLNDKKPYYFNNVAEMKEYNLSVGDMAITLGYYSPNDGGGTEYQIVNSSSSYYVTLENNLYAKPIFNSNIINPKQFGAYCDGTHDDSDTFEACLNYVNTLSSSNGTWKRTILIPATIRVTRRIDCTADQFKMYGTSINNSKIVFVGSDSYLNIEKPNNANSHEIEIENIKLYGDYSQTQSILKMTRCINCYLTRVETCNGGENEYNISFINCDLIFMDRCTIVGSNDVANYPGNRNGIYINNEGSIFNFTNANCWNLNNVFKFGGQMQNVNIKNNWIECIKSLLEIDCAADMRYMNLKIENNTINVHKQSENFIPTTFNFISFAMATDTNLFGTSISINKNTIYLWDVTNINGNSLIYLDGIGASQNASWDINYNSNVFSGKHLNELNAYVFYNSISTFYNKYNVKFKSITTIISTEAARITDNKNIIACTITEGQRGQVTAPNGIYLGSSGTENYGNIYYDNGEFYGGYAGTIRKIPKRVGTAFAYATPSTDLVKYINDLSTALVQSGIIDRQI